MSKAKHTAALAAGALAVALGVWSIGGTVLDGQGSTEARPYRTVVPAPSPTVSVPAQAPVQPQEYVPVPAPTAGPGIPDPSAEPLTDDGLEASGDAAGDGGSSVPSVPGDEPTAPAADSEEVSLAALTVWDAGDRERAAAALAEADAYTAAHPDTAEAAVYGSVRRDLACGSTDDGTVLVTRALRAAGYTFSGCGPREILSWFADHPAYAAVLRDASNARPGSLVVGTGSSGAPVLGVYLADGLAVFGGNDLPASGPSAGQGPAGTAAGANRAVIAPVDLTRPALQPAGLPVDSLPVYVRPAPFA